MSLRRPHLFLAWALLLPALGAAQEAPTRPEGPGASPGNVSFDPAQASILRHRAWHDEYTPRQPYAPQAGFRNPGGVGRYAEYYPPGNQFQNPQQPGGQHVTARIGLGGVPDRAEQLAAYSAGTARYNALQTHIDRYGRPMNGFGLGFGLGW